MSSSFHFLCKPRLLANKLGINKYEIPGSGLETRISDENTRPWSNRLGGGSCRHSASDPLSVGCAGFSLEAIAGAVVDPAVPGRGATGWAVVYPVRLGRTLSRFLRSTHSRTDKVLAGPGYTTLIAWAVG
jgi:hypothetical protein